ncbi:tomoregulin-1-like [Antedon mediterranea]|uniref:tomoregulin-1-like n=1 Tax=Antedon mediterranea TaxID=105859 RepID=UPI003AF4AE5A
MQRGGFFITYIADINECGSNPCEAGEICTDGNGTYTCTCPEGTQRPGCTPCTSEGCHNRLRLKCASDGRTYRNRCYLNHAACLDPTIRIISRGPCRSFGTFEVIGGPRICLGIEDSSSSESFERTICPPTQAPTSEATTVNDMPTTTATEATTVNDMPTTTATAAIVCQNECPLSFEPLCGGNGVKNTTFPNICVLEAIKCNNDPELTVIHEGECIV